MERLANRHYLGILVRSSLHASTSHPHAGSHPLLLDVFAECGGKGGADGAAHAYLLATSVLVLCHLASLEKEREESGRGEGEEGIEAGQARGDKRIIRRSPCSLTLAVT